jgi:hypothetical protein
MSSPYKLLQVALAAFGVVMLFMLSSGLKQSTSS